MADLNLKIDKFYGGIVLDDKSNIAGVASNVEEIDIFENENYFQAEQIMTLDSMPASTEIYSYDVGFDDTLYGLGKNTSDNKARIVSTANAGATNPGALATLFTSSSTDTVYPNFPIAFHQVTETTQKNYVYYITGTNTLKRYGDLSGSPSESTVGTLSGLTGTYDRPWMLRLFGDLYIGHGQYIAKVNKDAGFTEKAFTLPNGWQSVSAIGLADTMAILCRNNNRLINRSIIYTWDLVASTQFTDSINIPFGGPQWIKNHKEAVRVCCAINGELKLYQVTGSFPVQTHTLKNVGVETTYQPISPDKSVTFKSNILYFGLFKTDKSGIYALGQLKETTPLALILSKRFHTSSYALHAPTSLFIQGPNYYAAFSDNSTASNSRCESNNSPARSSNAVYESIWLDGGKPTNRKNFKTLTVHTYPLTASTSVAASVDFDYSGSYTSVTRDDGSAFNTTSGLMGSFNVAKDGKRAYKVKLALTSSTVYSPKVVAVFMEMILREEQDRKAL